jgi:hypothetical protein
MLLLSSNKLVALSLRGLPPALLALQVKFKVDGYALERARRLEPSSLALANPGSRVIKLIDILMPAQADSNHSEIELAWPCKSR